MPLSLSHLYNLFGILQGRFFSSLPFAHVLLSFFISVWIHGHLFYTLQYSPILVYFFYNYSTWAIGNSSSWLLLTYSHQCTFFVFVFFFFFEHFLPFWHYETLTSRLFPFPVPKSDISRRIPIPFIGEWFQKSRSGCQLCLLLQGCHFFQALPIDTERNIGRYANPYMFT